MGLFNHHLTSYRSKPKPCKSSCASGPASNKQRRSVHQSQAGPALVGNPQQHATSAPISTGRQHLSARVKTFIGKLCESQGAELRRTLFSLRQTFQDDPELAIGFVESDGLDRLIDVAEKSDLIHQNYILRGTLWANILALFKSSVGDAGSQATSKQQHPPANDLELLVQALTLINRTVSGLSSDTTALESFLQHLNRLDFNIISQKYSSQHPKLKEQFDIYTQTIELIQQKQTIISTDANSCHTNTQAKDSSEFARSYQDPSTDNMECKMVKELRDSLDERMTRLGNKVHQQQQQHALSNDKPASSQAISSCSNINEGTTEPQQVTNDDQYESANDDSSHTLGSPSPAKAKSSNESLGKSQKLTSEVKLDNQRSGPSTLPAPVIRPVNVQATSREQNLTRGKQQRASISSCSSSDSYASYGSGYASGSGNSTDHESKQQRSAVASKETVQASATSPRDQPVRRTTTTPPVVDSAGGSLKGDEDEDVEEEIDGEEDEVADDESQLKRHLSELEQLTDELSSKNIFASCLDSHQQLSKQQTIGKDLSPNIQSSSSSVLSTGSNLSSLSSTAANEASHQSELANHVASAVDNASSSSAQRASTIQLSPPTGSLHESRSTSSTPTSKVQVAALPAATALLTEPNSSSRQSTSTTSSIHQAHQSNISGKLASTSQQPVVSQASARVNANSKGFSCEAQPLPSSVPANQQQQVTASGKQEPYYHNLFQWEQLVSKGVTRPLLINDLDFTDLRDEDDCDLLNNTNNPQRLARAQVNNEPLTISIPDSRQATHDSSSSSFNQSSGAQSHDSVDSISHDTEQRQTATPINAPPPMPPPPITPWFSTIATGSRPQSQFMSSPSPTYEFSLASQQHASNEFNRDQSPANSTYSNYSRNSVCVPQTSTPTKGAPLVLHQYNTMQPASSLRSASSMSSLLFGNNGKYANKRKKTMKLFWKEVREDSSLLSKLTKKKTIWDEIKPVQLDTQKLEHLFESKAKDLMLSKSRNGLDGTNQRKVKITVLDAKRSNAINIGMTKLPPMRTIKSAILKMDSSIMNREGIEKILTTMMPSEEEKSRIIEAQLANPDTPLGTAEQFLLNLASISALEARLKLWAFQLDYAQIEKEVAEPLMDLKQAIEEIEQSETFRIILGTLLAIGNFLNSTNAKGFQIDYLEKVPEVKDTVHKHSLLHHLCLFIQEKFDPQLTSDLYSEFSAVNRASKVDYNEVAKNLKKMQQDCKASWDYLKIVAKHDGLANLMNTCGSSNPSSSASSSTAISSTNQQLSGNCSNSASTNAAESSPIMSKLPKSAGKLNNLSKLSMITTVIGSDSSSGEQQTPTTKQLKTKVSDFLTDCAERIMVLMVIHRRVMNRFQKLLVYLGCPSHQIKQTQPQQILKIINEFALEYRTKRERVKEMLMKKQQCQHYRQHQVNRWQLHKTRWAGSQQCIDSMGYTNYNRPSSTASSCASSFAINFSGMSCNDTVCGNGASVDNSIGNASKKHLDTINGSTNERLGSQANEGHRANSPSNLSQISNYSDYLFDQSCCNSRQQSVTPVPSDRNSLIRRPHSMSISMFDLQNQQHPGCRDSSTASISAQMHAEHHAPKNSDDPAYNELEQARRKDEQLRRVLGAGKSFDGACNELYQMSHWSTTMARVSRPPPASSKFRSVSLDESSAGREEVREDESRANCQSSYYRNFQNGNRTGASFNDELEEQNSDDEILQSLVRTATARGSHMTSKGSPGIINRSGNSSSSQPSKGVRSKILSRFNCDNRKSCE